MPAADERAADPWDLSGDLRAREQEALYRRARVRDGGTPLLREYGRELLNFCGNDYLGLAGDPRLMEAAAQALSRDGAGSGAAHLVSGHRPEHQALEEELADWLGRERVLLFSTGYMANLGVLDALLDRSDLLLQDRLNHASLLDGGRLCGARMRRYPHADAAQAARWLSEGEYRRRLLVTDGVFSMDGDIAPLDALAEHCRASGAWLMVDDAHGLGVLGPQGRGSVAHFGLSREQVPVLMGTLGKAFGSFGAFVAGSEALIETLVQRARTFIYTTAPPTAQAAASRAALRIIREEPERREHLRALIGRFRAGAEALGLPLLPSATPIQPLVLGGSAEALNAAEALAARGLLVSAIRPPTVPVGTARLRITLSAAHSEAQVDRLLDALAEIRPGQAS